MKKLISAIAVVGLLISICPFVSALKADLPLDKVTPNPGFPMGLVALLKCKPRVNAFFVNFWDNYFYTGDTETLNTVIDGVSKLKATDGGFIRKHPPEKGATVIVVLHPGQGITERDGKKIPYDWSIVVGPPSPERNEIPQRFTTEAVFHVWLGGNIDLNKLKVPADVEVRSGGEIEKFIENHKSGK